MSIAHDHSHEHASRPYLLPAISLTLLATGLVMDHWFRPAFFEVWGLRLAFYFLAYILVGWGVMVQALKEIAKGSIFTEFLLMSLATIGAFGIGEYPEGVAVMLFYTIGELVQDAAVDRAKDNIKNLLDIRPHTATVQRNGTWQAVEPETVRPGEIIQVKPGEKIALDGVLLAASCSLNTSALTGESKPVTVLQDETVLAGTINLNKVIELKVSRPYEESSLARILTMVQDAATRKARTELLIRRFARIYTPIVFFLALGLMFLPALFVHNYVFSEWLYRGLVFLVISCPCALVISIPLGYFGGIGAASRHGILFKGSSYMDVLRRVNAVVMDKTGTLTKALFRVKQVVVQQGTDEAEFLRMLAALESHSTHPVAKAILSYTGSSSGLTVEEVEERPGQGLTGHVDGRMVHAGNLQLLRSAGVSYDPVLDALIETIVVVAIDGVYTGYVLIADELKEDASALIRGLKANGVDRLVVLSGDKSSITQKLARDLGIAEAYGDLLPEQKVEQLQALKKDPNCILAFIGDGINDAPVLALSDVGIAMGGLGSDAAIETADVVIQNDQPSRLVTAMAISKATHRIVIQNISMAFAVKLVVLALGAGGIATLWEAVFADVGVALLAILNAIRIQHLPFSSPQ